MKKPTSLDQRNPRCSPISRPGNSLDRSSPTPNKPPLIPCPKLPPQQAPITEKPNPVDQLPPHSFPVSAFSFPLPQSAAQKTEKRRPVDQPSPTDQSRYDRARTFILANRPLFSAQGSIVASWRTRHGKRFGPYYRLAYRRNGRQRSIYLGAAHIADHLRDLLARLQEPQRLHRLYQRLQAQVRHSLRQAKKHLAQQLAPYGVTVRGYEFRGAARAFCNSRQKPRSTALHSRANLAHSPKLTAHRQQGEAA